MTGQACGNFDETSNPLWQCGTAERSFLGPPTCIRWLLCRQEKVIHFHCYHRLLYLSYLIQPSYSNIISLSLLSCSSFYKSIMQFFCVMTVLVSDVQLIGIRWSLSISLFYQWIKFKDDWDFDLALFWCFHNHRSLKMTEILISPVQSHGTINQKRTDS